MKGLAAEVVTLEAGAGAAVVDLAAHEGSDGAALVVAGAVVAGAFLDESPPGTSEYSHAMHLVAFFSF